MITTVADRLKEVKEYYFSIKLREVAARIKAGQDIVNLGIGSPDLPPPSEVVEVMKAATQDEMAHAYKSYQGIPQLREAMASFYKDNFKVLLDSDKEVLPLMGSKEGIMHLSMAFLNQGDAVLIPNPGYPTYTSVTKLVGATPIYYDLNPDDHWFSDLRILEQKVDLSRVKLMWLNYPNMPTGALADAQQYDAFIAFARKHRILLVNDNPYAFILNDKPMSILSRPHAKEVALELNSLSKTFNMAGWRIGMLMGHQDYLQAVLKIKSNMDSGMFYPLQMGAVKALSNTDVRVKSLNKIYAKRRKLIWQLLDLMGCTYRKDFGGLFVWAKIPKGKTSAQMTDLMLDDYETFVAPGTIFGSGGKGYIRLSLCVCETNIQKVINRIKNKPLC